MKVEKGGKSVNHVSDMIGWACGRCKPREVWRQDIDPIILPWLDFARPESHHCCVIFNNNPPSQINSIVNTNDYNSINDSMCHNLTLMLHIFTQAMLSVLVKGLLAQKRLGQGLGYLLLQGPPKNSIFYTV